MPQIIKLSINKIKGEAPASAVSYGFDIDDIVVPITFNSSTSKSTVVARQIKGSQPDGRSVAKIEYEVNHTLSAIAAMSDQLFVGTVLNRRGVVSNGQRVFNASKISENLVPTVNGTKFFYIENGDPNPVEYEVSEDIDNIIGQLTATAVALINVRNGLTIIGGYVEQGGSLVHDTTIDLDQWFIEYISTVLGYTTSFRKAYNMVFDSIYDGDVTYSFGKQAVNNYTEWNYSISSTGKQSINRQGEGVGTVGILGNPVYGISNQVVSSVNVMNMFYVLDEENGFTIAGNTGITTDNYFRVNQLNVNGAGILESLPTYSYVPAAVSTQRLVGVNVAGEFFNTGIDPTNVASKDLLINSQSGANYGLVLADDGKLIQMTNAGANTLTIPTNASIAFPIGAQILGYQDGAGQTTVTPAGGVTIKSPGGRTKTSAQYSSYSLIKVDTNVWLLSGDITT